MVLENYVYKNKVQFLAKVTDVAARLGINPDWLMTVMFLESSLNSQAVNPTTKAVGLIQIMPKYLASYGTTSAAMMSMSNVDQMEIVYKYLSPFKGRMTSLTDCYLAIFFPAAIGKTNDYVLQTSSLSAGLIASQNKRYDINGDGKITKGEIAQMLGEEVQKKKK